MEFTIAIVISAAYLEVSQCFVIPQHKQSGPVDEYLRKVKRSANVPWHYTDTSILLQEGDFEIIKYNASPELEQSMVQAGSLQNFARRTRCACGPKGCVCPNPVNIYINSASSNDISDNLHQNSHNSNEDLNEDSNNGNDDSNGSNDDWNSSNAGPIHVDNSRKALRIANRNSRKAARISRRNERRSSRRSK